MIFSLLVSSQLDDSNDYNFIKFGAILAEIH
jgi:hypothetical protein